MKRQVGQRQHPDPEMKAILGLVQTMATGSLTSTQKSYSSKCAGCGSPVAITLTEEVDTGKIWMDGPDSCANCGRRLANLDTQLPQLSQATIEMLFGKF